MVVVGKYTFLRITVKEKELLDCNDELNKLVEINQNLTQRNRRLYETRVYNMERASEEYKSFNKQVNAKEQCSREEVINELKDLWRFKLSEEKNLISMSYTLQIIDFLLKFLKIN